MRHKWFRLDTETWLSDSKLKLISYREKGIWIDVICLCQLSEKYGYLVMNGTKMCLNDVGMVLNLNKTDQKHLKNLAKMNILRQDDEGCYYCHKLVKDKEYSDKQAAHGAKRWDKNPKGRPEADPLPESESERDRYKEKDIKEDFGVRPSVSFSPPTLEEVKKFIKNRGLKNLDAEDFHKRHSENNWHVGKDPIRNWRSFLQAVSLNNNPLTAQKLTTGAKSLTFSQMDAKDEKVFWDTFMDVSEEVKKNTERHIKNDH